MFENTSRSRSVVGGAAGLTFVLALAVAVGIVPQAGAEGAGSPALSAASVAPTVPVPAPETPPVTDAPAPPPAPEAPPATSRHSSAVSAAPQESDEAAPEAAAPASAPAASTGVARVTPTSAQVQAAIQGFHQRIPLYTPTAAQVADFGNQVCTAFDQGQSYAQVKATGLQMVAQHPFVSVTSADADWMIHTAVSLYCPGYASKLS